MVVAIRLFFVDERNKNAPRLDKQDALFMLKRKLISA